MKILVLTHDSQTIQTIQRVVDRFRYECVFVSKKEIDQYVVNKMEHGIYRILFKKGFDATVLDEEFLNLLKKRNLVFQDSDISQHPTLLIVDNYQDLDMKSVRMLRVSSMIPASMSDEEFHAHLTMIYEKSQSNLKTDRWASSDSLTGLFNRRTFISSISSYFSECKECNIPFTLAMLDLDHFKFVNDTYGHYAGDRLLKFFSDIMAKNIRTMDFLARIGGEEFAMILPMSTSDEALEVLKRIREDLFVSDAIEDFLKVTFSAGVVSSSGEFENVDEMLHNVDMLLYQAKEQGRDKVCF